MFSSSDFERSSLFDGNWDISKIGDPRIFADIVFFLTGPDFAAHPFCIKPTVQPVNRACITLHDPSIFWDKPPTTVGRRGLPKQQ
jgi:hypothetical protein